jgi:putative ubiquitin-RnfH superfamily antitoxin RatB of RatAB toxin-antitoxin module
MSTASEPPGETFRVEVVYATRERQVLVPLEVAPGCTVAEAIERSGLDREFPGMTVDPQAVGIFGRKVPPDQLLAPGDRVEIYRPLIADPKEARRRRAQKRDGKSEPRA